MAWPLLDIAARTLADDYGRICMAPPEASEALITVQPVWTTGGSFIGWDSYRVGAATWTGGAS